MDDSNPLLINAAVEGVVDEAALRRVFRQFPASLHRLFVMGGKSKLIQRLPSYNHAAVWHPWIVLIDLDQDADCAPTAKGLWLPTPEPNLCFRIAVRAVEAWLLADSVAISNFLHVPVSRIPTQPETLTDPKRTLVDLAQRSRRSSIVADMTPRQGSGRGVGPAYTSRLIEFASFHWRPDEARKNSDSLNLLFHCVERLSVQS